MGVVDWGIRVFEIFGEFWLIGVGAGAFGVNLGAFPTI